MHHAAAVRPTTTCSTPHPAKPNSRHNKQVYYVPLVPVVDGDCMPTLCAFFPIFRQILIRERITLVHGHQASSVMSHEAILFAKTMGYRVAYTDHSLFGFADAARCAVQYHLVVFVACVLLCCFFFFCGKIVNNTEGRNTFLGCV